MTELESLALLLGAVHSQLRDAQTEVLALRDQNEALREHNDTLRCALDNLQEQVPGRQAQSAATLSDPEQAEGEHRGSAGSLEQ